MSPLNLTKNLEHVKNTKWQNDEMAIQIRVNVGYRCLRGPTFTINES